MYCSLSTVNSVTRITYSRGALGDDSERFGGMPGKVRRRPTETTELSLTASTDHDQICPTVLRVLDKSDSRVTMSDHDAVFDAEISERPQCAFHVGSGSIVDLGDVPRRPLTARRGTADGPSWYAHI